MGHVHRLIVFDLDGTLIDSRQDLTDAVNALVVERGARPLPSDEVAAMVGEGAALLVRRALAAAELPDDAQGVGRFLELYDERLLATTRLYPGMRDVLEALAAGGAVLAVLTNKPLAPARRLLSALEVAPLFATILGGDGPLPRKPDPASLRHLIASHHATAPDTVLVGDSRIDLETARAAGVAICLARYGFGYRTIGPGLLRGDELVVDAPADIPPLLAEALRGKGG